MAFRLQVRGVTTADDLFGDTRTVLHLFKYKTIPLQDVQFSEKYLRNIFTFVCDYKTIPHTSDNYFRKIIF